MRLFRLSDGVIEMPEKDSATRIIRSTDLKTASTAILHVIPNPGNETMRFYSHKNAYAAFIVWTGCFLFFDGDKTEQLRGGDFIFIPPVREFLSLQYWKVNQSTRELSMAINH